MTAAVRLLTGNIPSPHDPKDWDFANSPLFGSMGTKVRSIDATGTHIRRYQGASNCTGYATATGVQDFDLKLVELGIPVHFIKLADDGSVYLDGDGNVELEDEPRILTEALPLLSGMWDYTGARRMWFRLSGQSIPDTGIPDGGSSYRHNVMILRDVENGGGARTEEVWPDIAGNIARVPPAHVDQANPFIKLGGYYRIHGEGNADILRNGICSALEGFMLGKCSKPMGSMLVTEGFANTKEGEVYDDKNPGKDLGGHAMLISGYDADTDSVVFDNTWPGPRTYRVRIEALANPKVGGETWVFNQLLYIPRLAA